MKTDNTGLYEFTLEVIRDEKLKLVFHTADLYRECPPERHELVEIRTYYENLFHGKGESIKYILFTI